MPSAHKGDAGKVLVIGGNKGYGGAISICAQGALRAGAGLIKVATDKGNVTALNTRRPELMTVDLHDSLAMQQAIAWADVIAIGPGLGLDPENEVLLEDVLNAEKPTVIDADALNVMAHMGLSFCKRAVLTPHPGEAARLLGTTIDRINSDRYKAVYELQQKCGGVVLLKGAGTLICDGKSIVVIQGRGLVANLSYHCRCLYSWQSRLFGRRALGCDWHYCFGSTALCPFAGQSALRPDR